MLRGLPFPLFPQLIPLREPFLELESWETLVNPRLVVPPIRRPQAICVSEVLDNQWWGTVDHSSEACVEGIERSAKGTNEEGRREGNTTTVVHLVLPEGIHPLGLLDTGWS